MEFEYNIFLIKIKMTEDITSKDLFTLDSFKRHYSNDKTEDAIEWLWSNLDQDNYSFYDCTFKDNDQLKGNQLFMTTNLIGGFFRSLDKLRKNGFASAVILGDRNEQQIHFLWLFKGTEIPSDLKINEDQDIPFFDRFHMSKLNLSNFENKTLINDYLLWNNIKGLPFLAGKIFK